jgi:hypothetical protein
LTCHKPLRFSAPRSSASAVVHRRAERTAPSGTVNTAEREADCGNAFTSGPVMSNQSLLRSRSGTRIDTANQALCLVAASAALPIERWASPSGSLSVTSPSSLVFVGAHRTRKARCAGRPACRSGPNDVRIVGAFTLLGVERLGESPTPRHGSSKRKAHRSIGQFDGGNAGRVQRTGILQPLRSRVACASMRQATTRGAVLR